MNDVVDEEVVEPPKQTLQELLAPKRGVTETYDAYRIRRKSANAAIKNYLRRGTLVFDSSNRKTYKGAK